MKELMKEREWFEPFVAEIGKGIVKTSAWGLMWRVTVGAVLSLTDLATDLLVLWQYWYRKKGVRRILREMAVVVIGAKPAVDAYRVTSGAEKEKDTMVYPVLEISYIKIIADFTGCIHMRHPYEVGGLRTTNTNKIRPEGVTVKEGGREVDAQELILAIKRGTFKM
ncbi:hypothetical protein TrLO_g15472 [Triparma laevis f. longispina]|uniref:Uncharacterized protein n=1 Tax=Triparma laevis f. longispina TaxID=1714387 RepID=A0A9W7C7N0_9STRA|nr:hypothetical protein TrLO_g15472 [Triparma laevis f. longispina]